MAGKLIDREEDIQQAAQAIKAIAHPLRLKILCVLGEREVSVQDIVEQVGTSQSNISQHLSRHFLWLAAFVGLNLFQSGLTAFCPLTRTLIKCGIREGSC